MCKGVFILMGMKEVEKKVIMLTCERCGYEWERRMEDGMPKQCPYCKTNYWNKKKTKQRKKPKVYM